MAVGRANRISPGSDRMIVLGVLAFAVVILTRGRWAEAQAHTVSAGWQVLESRTVGGKDVVVIGGLPGGDGHSTPRR